MDVEGGWILTEQQASDWEAAYPTEYAEYVDEGLFDPVTRELFDMPGWMNDGDPNNGPFDFEIKASHETIGW